MTRGLTNILLVPALLYTTALLPFEQKNQQPTEQPTRAEIDSLFAVITAFGDSIQSVQRILEDNNATGINPELSADELDKITQQLSSMSVTVSTMRDSLIDEDYKVVRADMYDIKEESNSLLEKFKKLTRQAFVVDPVDQASIDSLKTREGTLNTNDISIVLRGQGLIIKITPIDDEILQYCSPDVRRTFKTLRQNQEDLQYYYPDTDLRMFYVIFQAIEDRTRYEPDEIEIEHQGNFFRPVDILPLSDEFDLLVLEKKYLSLSSAIYLFDASIDYFEPLRFLYRNEIQNNRWNEIIRRLDNEKRRFKAESVKEG